VKFSIVVYAAPHSSQAAASALKFAKTVLDQGHELYRLFFFGDGVHNANSLSIVAQDDRNLQQQWHELIKKYDLDSVICVSSAIKRGIIDERESQRYELNAVSAYDSSEIAGLGQLIDATLHSDRVVNFG